MLRATVYTDGGCRPTNPGPAAYAYFVKFNNGIHIDHGKALPDVATNNEAEYEAVVRGLRFVHSCGASRVVLKSDSRLVVEQMKRQWRVREARLLPLWTEAQRIASLFDDFQIEWIPREQNTVADLLVTQALSSQIARERGSGEQGAGA